MSDVRNPQQFWHITPDADFRIDPEQEANVARGLGGKIKGLYVTTAPNIWHRHPYLEGREYAAEIEYPEHKEVTIPDFEAVLDPRKAKVKRVIPAEEAVAEVSGYHDKRGWMPKDYRYQGPDTRVASIARSAQGMGYV